MRAACCALLLLSPLYALADGEARVPAHIIRLPESVKIVFVAETTTASFHRFEYLDGRRVRHLGKSYMSIGQNGDRKKKSGDRKTPLGVYFVTEQLDTSRMHEKYGDTAFPLDYPNALDVQRQRTGAGIWVHGVDRRGGERPRYDTDGCIALPNDVLADLESLFEPNLTPVLIARAVEWTAAAHVDALRRELEAAVQSWAGSRRRGDLYTLLSLYDNDFQHWGMNKREWETFQIRTLSSRPLQSIVVTDLLLLEDPVEEGVYLSRFRMQTRESGRTVIVTKRLYWRRGNDDVLRIIVEGSG